MLNKIKAFFDSNIASDIDDDAGGLERLQLASAALLIEVMNADHELDERESAQFVAVVKAQLGLDDGATDELLRLAREEAAGATSLYEFTRLINDSMDYEEKLVLMENMWRIAFSDQRLDKYEDHLIRKIGDLIYVSHSDFIRTKLKVRGDVS
ncbi:MAG: TerB family tellurite resistance protein [Pseudohongiellaceae bacterium]